MFRRQQLEDVVVDHYFGEVDGLPAEGTLASGLQILNTLSAYGMMHAANNNGLFLPPVVLLNADIAFVDVFQLVCQAAPVHQSITIYNFPNQLQFITSHKTIEDDGSAIKDYCVKMSMGNDGYNQVLLSCR